MIGKTVSHYKITRELGSGGMGVVFEAVDTKLDRTVALKFLTPESTRDSDAKARFVHEAKAASAIDHPNVCNIYEIDETDDGHLFLAMACYEGETLKHRIDQGPLPLDDALDITRQVAEGLAKAHERDIVHRDIKPANIFITNDGVVKILDFGLAKLAGLTQLTQEGTTLGTAHYMSPEQADGQEADHRADLWCLGVVLYEMVTGRVPFQGDHAQAVVYAIQNKDVEPVTGIRTGVSLALERFIGKCLAKNPKERYQSAGGLLSDLIPIRKASEKQESGKSVSFVRPTRRSIRWPWVVVLVVLGIVIGALAWRYLLLEEMRPGAEPAIAVIDFSNLFDLQDQVVSATLTSLINTSLTEHSPIRVVSPSYQEDIRRRLFGSSPNQISADQALEVARQASASFLLTGEITRLGDKSHVIWRLTNTENGESLVAGREEGEDLLLSADLVVGKVLPLLGGRVKEKGREKSLLPSVMDLTTRYDQAYQHLMAGLLAREEMREQDEITSFEQAVAIDSTFALAYFELSRTYGREHGLARIYSDKAWLLKSKLGFKDRMRLEAWRHWVDYRVKDALAVHREMLDRWPDDREILGDLVEKLFANWYAEDALKTLERGLELYPNDREFGRYYWLSLAMVGRLNEALDANKTQVQRFPRAAVSHEELGSLYLWMGEPDSAEIALARSIELEPTYVWGKYQLASLAFARGDLIGAIRVAEDVLEQEGLSSYEQLALRTTFVNYHLGLTFLFLEAGRLKDAHQVIEEAREFAADPESELRRVTGPKLFLFLRTDRASEVLSWARQARHSDSRVTRLQALKSEILALVELDSLESARRALTELRATEEYWGGYTQYMVHKISAHLALAENDPDSAMDELQELSRNPSPGGMYDIEYREMLARTHLLAGRPDEAAAVHLEMLGVYGGHALSHYELGGIYEEMNRFDDARQSYEKFLEMWAEADEGLPQLDDARSRLGPRQLGQ